MELIPEETTNPAGSHQKMLSDSDSNPDEK